ncbi:PREDICTED: probable aspartate aminotransferase, cytoplasmic [Amphimedon queenslandica]|uniref:aspartate transaminase n=1 Tax=Amphimedon queenslandica TaxID=400682 RepID=A0AAN0J5X9_AMPQE|nr:PREDICTED: probable aspartate aminotransferase, cytoplasmic [Amphimedon queenslandica]|eukprot:XP_019852419.1 PREDICTED: probable aspartate aminotransferase, cytoplasmic [Amphimedon queenslandica]
MSSPTSVFDGMEAAPPDAVFNVLAKYKEDTFPKKVNLSVGAYRDEEGQPWVLPVVKTVETQMSSDVMLNHEYLPIDGLKSFTESATRLVLGSDGPAVTQNRYCSIQCLSGTGSIRAALDMRGMRKA